MVNFTTTNIVGPSSKEVWAQAQTVTNAQGQQTMIVIQLRCVEEGSLIDLASLGSTMLLEIESKGERGLESIISDLKEGLRVDILIATLNGTTLSLCGKGEVEAYLARNGQLARLGSSSQGEICPEDVVVVSTAKLVESIGLAKFKSIVTEEDGPAELLAPLLHTQSEISGVAAVVGVCLIEKTKPKWLQIKLRSDESPRKINLWVGGIIFLLLVMMIGVGMVRKVRVVAEKDYANLSSSVDSKIAETLSIGDINPERARQLLSQAKNETEAYLASDLRDEYRLKAQKLITEIDSADQRAFKKNEVKLTTIVELPILVEGLTAEKMKSDGKGNLVFLGKTNKKIVAMNLTDRSRQVIDFDSGLEFGDLGVSETKVYGLDTAGASELFWKKSDIKKIIEADEFWKDPKYISIFAGNIYILDSQQGEIWKYPTLGETFGGRRRWFAVGITPDLSNVVDMKVVGDIWLLTSTGKLERYSRGAPVSFWMEGFPSKGEAKRFSEPSAIWVTDSLVYVLENGANRVVVFGTDGKYQSQYVSSEFGKARDLVVVDDKAYVLIEDVVKEFPL